MEAKDRVTEVLVEALRKALAVPGEHRLYRAGKLDGLLGGRGGAHADAAARAFADDLLRRTRVEVKGKTEIDWVEVTPKGVEFLHQRESPAQALHEFRATLRANQKALPLWLDGMREALREIDARLTADAERWRQRLEAMERRVCDTLRRLEAASPLVPPEVLEVHPWAVDAINFLDRRHAAGAPPECPLPDLFAAVAAHHPELSLAAFHDGLRRLRQRRAVELRPTDDPAGMARPEFALLDGDGVFYLATR
jgi:hypothetical protein